MTVKPVHMQQARQPWSGVQQAMELRRNLRVCYIRKPQEVPALNLSLFGILMRHACDIKSRGYLKSEADFQ